MMSTYTRSAASGLSRADALEMLERWRRAADAIRPQGAPAAMKKLIDELATIARNSGWIYVFGDVVSDAAGEANMTLLRTADPPDDKPPARIHSRRGKDDSTIVEYGGTDRWVRLEWTDATSGEVDIKTRFDFWIPDGHENEVRELTGAQVAARFQPDIAAILDGEAPGR